MIIIAGAGVRVVIRDHLGDILSLLLTGTTPSNPPLSPMGKSQKKRAMRRHNPMRVPDSHLPKGLAAASSSSNKTEAVLPIIKKVEPLLFFFPFFTCLSPLISHGDIFIFIFRWRAPTPSSASGLASQCQT